MLNKNRDFYVTIFLAMFFLALGASPASGADEATPFDEGWLIRFGGVGIGSGLDFESLDADGTRRRSSRVNGGGGVAVSGEYRFTPRLGFELGLTAAAEVDWDFEYPLTTETLGFSALAAGLNFHLTPDRKVDVYVGPLLAYVQYGDFTYSTGHYDPGTSFPWWPVWVPGTTVDVSLGDDLAFGGTLGFDVRFGESRWMFCAAVRYLTADADGTGSRGGVTDVDFEPVIVGLGAGYRF